MQSGARTRLNPAFLLAALLTMHAPSVASQSASDAASSSGQHGFDWEIGTWRTELHRLKNPLSGSHEWVQYTGTSVVRKVLDGRANLVELRVEGPSGRIEGVSLRLYNPHTEQWNLNYASVRDGALARPVYGGFQDGHGEFFGLEDLDGRAVLVRFVISEITNDSARFEQAFSEDGGRTWETNWIATDTRVRDSR